MVQKPSGKVRRNVAGIPAMPATLTSTSGRSGSPPFKGLWSAGVDGGEEAGC